MEYISFWAVVLVSILVFMQGSSAVTVFVQKGKDVLLALPKSLVLQKTDVLTWRFSENNIIVRFIPGNSPIISNDYTGRVSVTNYSVILNDLQAADSGVYEARVIRDKEQTIAEYKVTVQDPVSPVELNVNPVLNSSDSCVINATCRTADSDISSSFRCVHHTCDQDRREQSETTNSGASLRIYLLNVSIFCNHSNQVSWTKNMTKIQDFCKLDPEYDQSHTNGIAIALGTVSGVVFILAVAVAAGHHRRKRRQYDTENTENTIYATPQVENTQTQCEISPGDASCASATSTYSLVGLHSRPTETRDNPLPESLYATVDKPAKVEKPVRPCKNLQEL